MSKTIEEQARQFHYNLKQFQTAMTAYETRLNSVQISKTRKKQMESNGGFKEDIEKWGKLITSNEQGADEELQKALEAFGKLKESLQ